jgi:hypothetical protein
MMDKCQARFEKMRYETILSGRHRGRKKSHLCAHDEQVS